MRILVWHVHGSWATSFVAGGHEYLVPVVPDRGPDGRGRARTWDWPPGAREVAPDELADLAADRAIDVVVLQRPEEVQLLRRWTWLVPGRDVPAVYVEHNAPTGHAAATRHPLADLDVVEEGLVPIVHVTAFNALMSDTLDAHTLVVDHGIPDPGPLYTGERASVGVVVNETVRRWRVAGTDVLVGLGRHVPLDVYGMGVGKLAEHLAAPGAAPHDPPHDLPHDLPHGLHDDVPQAAMHAWLATSRAYLHPYRWTSLGLSLLEAMALGMPVLALPTTEAPVAVPPAAGLLSARPDELAATARRWLADPDDAREPSRACPRPRPRAPLPRRVPAALGHGPDGGDLMKIAMISEHASPLAALGGVDAGGQNVHVASLATRFGAQGHRVEVFTRRRRDPPEARPARARRGGRARGRRSAGAEPKDDLLPDIDSFERRPPAAVDRPRAPAQRRARPLLDVRDRRPAVRAPARGPARADLPRARLRKRRH